jgi:hypothetical protein
MAWLWNFACTPSLGAKPEKASSARTDLDSSINDPETKREIKSTPHSSMPRGDDRQTQEKDEATLPRLHDDDDDDDMITTAGLGSNGDAK